MKKPDTHIHPTLQETPSQTAGPFVHIGCTPNFVGNDNAQKNDLGAVMVNADTQGQRITVSGKIYDSDNQALSDAMVEIWQADAKGFYPAILESRGHKTGSKADPNFTGWGRCACDLMSGEYVFETIKPGLTPGEKSKTHAPHITFWIVARGINIGLHTRMYFPDEEAANQHDTVLQTIPQASRIKSLMARKIDATQYRFDIFLQGENETIFFDI